MPNRDDVSAGAMLASMLQGERKYTDEDLTNAIKSGLGSGVEVISVPTVESDRRFAVFVSEQNKSIFLQTIEPFPYHYNEQRKCYFVTRHAIDSLLENKIPFRILNPLNLADIVEKFFENVFSEDEPSVIAAKVAAYTLLQ